MKEYDSELSALTNTISEINDTYDVKDLKSLKEKLKKLKAKVITIEKQCESNQEDSHVSKKPRIAE